MLFRKIFKRRIHREPCNIPKWVTMGVCIFWEPFEMGTFLLVSLQNQKKVATSKETPISRFDSDPCQRFAKPFSHVRRGCACAAAGWQERNLLLGPSSRAVDARCLPSFQQWKWTIRGFPQKESSLPPPVVRFLDCWGRVQQLTILWYMVHLQWRFQRAGLFDAVQCMDEIHSAPLNHG